MESEGHGEVWWENACYVSVIQSRQTVRSIFFVSQASCTVIVRFACVASTRRAQSARPKGLR